MKQRRKQKENKTEIKIDFAEKEEEIPEGNQEKITSFFDRNILQQLITVELFIGAVVVLWYAIIYSYQLGFKSYYGIPSFYIEVSITKLLEPGFYLSITMLSIMTVLFISKVNLKPIYRMNASIILPFIFAGLFYLSVWKMVGVNIVAIILLFPVLISLVLLGLLFKNRNYNVFLYFIVLMFFILIANLAGGYYAASKDTYYLLKENGKDTRKIILDTYNEFYIVAPLNERKQIVRNFELIEMKQDEKTKPTLLFMDQNSAQTATKQMIIAYQNKQNGKEQEEEKEKTMSVELRYTGPLMPADIERY